LFAVYFESVDHFCHGFMRYHPPRQPWIGGRDFDLYHNVVSMAYQFHDEMLGTLIQKAGDDAVVILMSDHGFHPDHLRPASIPDIPAGPAVEHRDQGVFAICGPGIKPDQTVYGPSVLDITPTVLGIFGLPVGEDMDGKVLSQVFTETPKVEFIPSWENVPGADGRHPRHTWVDPVAAHEAMEQLIALGYVERPGSNREAAMQSAARDLQYNLGEAYQDDGRHAEAHEIFRELYEAAPDEQRFAVRLFVSCQALGLRDEMRTIVDSDHLSHFEPLVADYLKAQMLIVEQRYAEALDALEPLIEMNQSQTALYLQAGDLCEQLGRDGEAQRIYEKALSIDPDSAHAAIGLCRIALERQEYTAATQLALDALQRVYQNPEAHFLLGRALAGMEEYARAADAFRAAISFNPNFPEAHSRLADLLVHHLGDAESAREHRELARSMKAQAIRPQPVEPVESTAPVFATPVAAPLVESLIVVTGLPRSGTSLLMQLLAAGGVSILSDEKRLADEDNPRGYLEYEPVKNLLKDSKWLREARGKAVKIVAPLLMALPPSLPCRVILCERDLDEVLDSQERMLAHRNQTALATPARRRTLKDEYLRTLDRVKTMLAARPDTHTLIVDYHAAISGPLPTAERINHFLGGGLDVTKMVPAVDPALHRNRRIQI
jgi:tetratricopeptide (TPR) repeat protein